MQSEDKQDVRICDRYWYDCQMIVSLIDGIHSANTNFLSENNMPRYRFKDFGVDLFCFRVVPNGLEAYYEVPLPLDHDSTVYGFKVSDYTEFDFNRRWDEFGVKPQKYQVKLKKM